jgi:hypothetical protein
MTADPSEAVLNRRARTIEAIEPRLLLTAVIGDTVFAGFDPDGAPREGVSTAYASVLSAASRGETARGHHEHFAGCGHVLPPIPDGPAVAWAPIDPQAGGGSSEVPALSSRPGALRTILLDFDGHTTSGTIWNTVFNDGLDFTTPAYDPSGNGPAFLPDERDRVARIWDRVAEDFAPFDVNVTTVDPGTAAMSKTGAGDERWGSRVVIGGSYDQWFQRPAGGVAYLFSFDDFNDEPVFVFSGGTDSVGGGEKFVAEAATHEAGHALGLRHDGQSPGDGAYYRGHEEGSPVGWAPSMGVGYYVPLVQWSRGEYHNANLLEDDYDIMTQPSFGVGFVPDDHADAVGPDATGLLLDTTGTARATGVISTPNDQDAFVFDHGGGPLSIRLDLPSVSPNLDAELRVFRDNGDESYTFWTSNNPDVTLDALATGTFDAGRWLVTVDGVGRGDPLASEPTGYTDYGSLGQFELTIEGTPSDTVAPLIDAAWVNGTGWGAAGLPAPGLPASDAATVPFAGIDLLTVAFSEDVLVDVADVPGAIDVEYDPATRVAVWRLDAPLTVGTRTFALDGVTDLAGNPLADPGVTLRILPGDINRDGFVNLSDFLALRSAFGTDTGETRYNLFSDLNLDGTVNLSDFLILRQNFGLQG